jgi:hypothetical protein
MLLGDLLLIQLVPACYFVVKARLMESTAAISKSVLDCWELFEY